MKRGAIARLVIWSLTALLLTGLLVSVLVFRSVGGDFRDWDFSIGPSGYTYKNASDYTAGGGEIYDAVSAIEVNWISGSINIEAYDGDSLQISETGAEGSEEQLRYLVRNGRLIIQYRKSGFNWFFSKTHKKSLTVKVPAETAAGLLKLETDSVSAQVKISGITAADCDISNVSGDITLDNVKLGRLDFDTVSGDLTASGEINAFESDSTSGTVNVSTAVTPGKIESDSVSGDVIFAIPSDSGFRVEFDSVSGDFDSDFPLKKQGDKYISGSGAAEYEADTTSGDFIIRELK